MASAVPVEVIVELQTHIAKLDGKMHSSLQKIPVLTFS